MNYLKFSNNFAADCIVEGCEIIPLGGIERSYLGRFAGPGKKIGLSNHVTHKLHCNQNYSLFYR